MNLLTIIIGILSFFLFYRWRKTGRITRPPTALTLKPEESSFLTGKTQLLNNPKLEFQMPELMHPLEQHQYQTLNTSHCYNCTKLIQQLENSRKEYIAHLGDTQIKNRAILHAIGTLQITLLVYVYYLSNDNGFPLFQSFSIF